MAEEKKNSFPLMPATHWWALRGKFKQTIPPTVSGNYLASMLNMEEKSARNNIIPYLKQVGIIDQDSKPTERAKKWRDDEQYPGVCKEILAGVYPQELLAIPDQLQNKPTISRWFANHTGAGENAVRKMVSFYMILQEANPSKGQENGAANPKAKAQTAKTTKASKVDKPDLPISVPEVQIRPTVTASPPVNESVPAIYLNLQIHISADAPTEQIEKIFESMAKYIYKKGQ